MHRGFIKLFRCIQDNPMWLEKPFSRGQAWIDLIMLANHKDGHLRIRGNKVEVKRGQIGWSEDSLAERWGWSRGKVRRFKNELENDQQIVQQKSNVTNLIYIVNYDKYQSDDTTDSTIDGTADGRQTVQQTDGRRYTNKNDKNDKNDKKEAIVPVDDIINIFHKTLPELPAVRKAGDALKRKMSARWKEYGQDNLDWWEGYFTTVKHSSFLTGKKTDFKSSLDWLLGPENMSKVLNGQYTDAQPLAQADKDAGFLAHVERMRRAAQA